MDNNQLTLQDKVLMGLKEARSSRGKSKGLLKAKCPPMDTYGAAAWQAIQGFSNPYKVGFGHIMFMSDDKREVYDYIVKVGNFVDLRGFDRDANALRALNLM